MPNENSIKEETDTLLLSYNEDSGLYEAIQNNPMPQRALNDYNAILLSSKNPRHYE